ncbi:MAG: GldG family protein [Lachnospiraceae bacterium]|nr:GldG family protein [Lachnospiraceae bacterium]
MMEKKNKGLGAFFKKIGDSFRSKGFRSGAYTTLISVLVIVAVIVVNLIVSTVDVRKDLTTEGKYSLTKETEELISDIKDELTFYYLTKNNASLSWFQTFFELYEKGSKKITFKNVDLVMNPKFAEQYTDKEVMQYSLIVVNETTGQSKYIPYEDMLLTSLSVDPYTYQYVENVVGIDVEGQINAAIQYVISGNQTNLYAVTGHGEVALGTEGENFLRKANINYKTFEVMKAEAVPEDCDVLYIAAPTTDYTETERSVIEAYADAGGDFLIVATYQDGMENFNKLLEKFGVKVENGIIMEGDPNYYFPGYPYILLPSVITTHAITQDYSGMEYVPMQSSVALRVLDKGAGNLSSSILLSTTGASYLKSGLITTISKEEGDLEGPFTVGLYVRNTDTGAEAVMFSTSAIFMDEYLTTASFINSGLLTKSVNYMAETEEVFTVRTISFEEEEKIVVTASTANAIGIVFVIVIPVLLIAAGIVVLIRRKSR